jgi:hypothetical protein
MTAENITSSRAKAQAELEQAETELVSLPARRDELLLRVHDLRRIANYPLADNPIERSDA